VRLQRLTSWLGLLVVWLLLSGCQAELLSAIDERQANEAVALLQKYNIKANKLKGEKLSFRVTVEDGDFAAAVDLLNAYGLPSPPDMEISQMFPADALVSTPTAERARLLSAIERRLEQSLMRIDQVISARAHASYELESSERRKTQRAMRLSVLLTYEGDLEEGLFIEKIKRFIKNGFHELRYEDIGVALFKRPEPVLRVSQAQSMTSQRGWQMGVGVGALGLLAVGGWCLSGRGRLCRRGSDKAEPVVPISARLKRLLTSKGTS